MMKIVGLYYNKIESVDNNLEFWSRHTPYFLEYSSGFKLNQGQRTCPNQ